MRLRSGSVIAVTLFLGLAVQTAFLGRFAILGAKPELLVLVVVAVAMVEGPVAGLLTGFAAGLLTDSLTDLPDGLSAVVFMLTGYGVGRVRQMFQRPSAWLPAAMVGSATLAALAVEASLSALVGIFAGSPVRTIVRIVLVAVYGMILTPFIFPVIARSLERQRPVLGSVVVRR